MTSLPATGAGAPQRSQATVLVVDDDASVVLLLRKVLERRGLKVLCAYTAAEAAAALAAQEVDLLVVDHQLPKHDGVELVVLARRKDPSIGVVMATALPRWKVDRTGLDGFLDKPFRSLREVEVCLANALEARHQRALRADLDAAQKRLDRPAK